MGPKKDFRSSEEVSILSKGVKIEGKFSSDGNVRIDGIIIGDVIVNGNLTLGDGSKIQGEINAKNVTISGSIEGSVKATEKVILESSSRLKGDVISKLLIIQEGAKFDGKSTMSPIPPSAPKPEIK
ncbi:MAG: polymer-forming cytoskeletal protein [Melioribacteraceae bacterium]|nr:polymer-forming cytoskeletal protein [Melioribacteraceae bacterium]MDD3557272.1 polymer-forming cytoskeletal protein [Melioribacteraceae bacterium]